MISTAKLFNKIGYEPFHEQQLYHSSESRFRTPVCGRRFGKSIMAGRDAEPLAFQPDKTIWVVGPTYALAEKEFRVIYNDLMIKLGMSKDRRIKKAYNPKQGEMFIRLPWNTLIEAKSADKPETLVGEALHYVIMSEAAKHKYNTWDQYIRPGLGDYRGKAVLPTTPEGYNWIYEFWQFGQLDSMPEYESWRFPSWKNIKIFPGGRQDPEIKLLERTMSNERFLQEIGAEFGAFAGKIFPEFVEEHNVKEHIFRPEWRNYIAFDFGWANPLAAVEFQVSPSDEIYVWREHYKSRMRLEEHIHDLKTRPQPEGYHLDLCFGDAADPEAVDYINVHFAPCIADPDSKSNWRDGIDTMKQFMRVLRDGPNNETVEERRYFVDPGCTNHIRELNNYKTKEDTAGKIESNPRGVADIASGDDHTIDAMRYALVHLFGLGAARSLSEAEYIDRSYGSSQPPVEVVGDRGDAGYFSGIESITQGMKF